MADELVSVEGEEVGEQSGQWLPESSLAFLLLRSNRDMAGKGPGASLGPMGPAGTRTPMQGSSRDTF